LKKYFLFSFTAHGLFFGALVALGTLLSRPPMSYYSVDLVSSLPSAPSVSPATPVTPETPKVKEPPVPAPVVPKSVPHEAIKIAAKTPKKPAPHVPAPKPKPVSKTPPSLPSWAVANNLEATNTSASPLGSNAASVSAKTGQPFPYPWYLKVVYSRLEKQWHAPDEALSCVITFVIGRDGAVSDIRVSKSSGDPFFDQVAQHAVSDTNPMPPLPSGYPEPSLKVHMTFERQKI